MTTANCFVETLHSHYAQQFAVDRLLYENKTDHFHCIIFENATFGRVMALDGVIQTTEKDEFIYHEMLAHVPLYAHAAPRRVLIVGGGDGGILREVLRHQTVEHVTLVEIDAQVIEMSQRFFPHHSQGAFDDPRVSVIIQDGLEFVTTQTALFDVIISDATDPIGPGKTLFSEKFYGGCKRSLASHGVLVTQNGVSFFQLHEAVATFACLRHLFADVGFYHAAIPTYVGGAMLLGFATDDFSLRELTIDQLRACYQREQINTRYYTPEVHHGAFALPAYVKEALR